MDKELTVEVLKALEARAMREPQPQRNRVRKGDRLRPSKGIHVGALNKVREQPRRRR